MHFTELFERCDSRSFYTCLNVGIEKLKGRENYVSWAFAMKMMLCRERCWDIVTARDDKTVDKDMDMRALSTIALSLEKHNYSLVMDANTAKEAWEKLKAAFTDDGVFRHLFMFLSLYCKSLFRSN